MIQIDSLPEEMQPLVHSLRADLRFQSLLRLLASRRARPRNWHHGEDTQEQTNRWIHDSGMEDGQLSVLAVLGYTEDDNP